MKKFLLFAVLAIVGMASFELPDAEARCRGKGLFRGKHPVRTLLQKIRNHRR